MTFEIIDNFLTEDELKPIHEIMFNSGFSWNFTPCVSSLSESDDKIMGSYYFTHTFYNKFHADDLCPMFAPILNKINVRALMRIKGNLYTSTEKLIHHDNHCDFPFEHRGAIFYLNTNDGLTVLEDGTEVKSLANRLLLFDPSKPHHSTTCTDEQCRMNVNFNFF